MYKQHVRTPIISPMQWPHLRKALPPCSIRVWFDAPLFGGLQTDLMWEAETLAMFNQAIYGDIQTRRGCAKEIEAELGDRRSRLLCEGDDDEAEWLAFKYAELRETYYLVNLDMNNLAAHADELTLVACWVLVEKYLGLALQGIWNELSCQTKTSHRWPDLENSFRTCGIELRGLASYDDAAECRIFNNAVKHGGIVTPSLARFALYTAHQGRPLKTVEPDVQRCYFGCVDFVGAVLEAAWLHSGGETN